MDISDRLKLQALLGGAGGTIATVLGGPQALAFGVFGPPALFLVAESLPEPGRYRQQRRALDNLPFQFFFDEGRFLWVDVSVSNMFKKLDSDFKASPLPSPFFVQKEKPDILFKLELLGGAGKTMTEQVEDALKNYSASSMAGQGRPSSEAIKKVANAGEIHVNCSIIEPAVLVTLRHMKQTFDIPLIIEYGDLNGVKQIETALNRLNRRPFDILVTANAPFALSGSNSRDRNLSNHYSFILPVHKEKQFVLRPKDFVIKPKSKSVDKLDPLFGVNKIRFLLNSSCQEQFVFLQKRYDQDFKREGQTLLDVTSGATLNKVEPNEAIVLYDPAAEAAVKSGQFVESDKYELWISLFGHNDFIRRHKDAKEAFIELFIAAWSFCRSDKNRRYVRKLLLQDVGIKSAYRDAMLRHTVYSSE